MPGAEADPAILSRRSQIQRLRRVADEALPQFGIEPVRLSLLQHRFNTTFSVTGRDGARYVLHILRPIELGRSEVQTRARVESELWWLDVVQRGLKLAVPVPVRTSDDNGVVSVDVEGTATPLQCTLRYWVDGNCLHRRLTPAHLEAVGRMTARLHNQSAHLDVPAWFDRPRVDRADAETQEEVVRLFTDFISIEAADVMGEVLGRMRRTQRELGDGSETFGVIHADIHQKNYLFRGRDLRLIDFGDCGWGHFLYDLAVTVSELRVLPRATELRQALVAGYREVRDLSGAQEALIDAFVMLRHVQNFSWFVKARDDPSYAGRTAAIVEGVKVLKEHLKNHV